MAAIGEIEPRSSGRSRACRAQRQSLATAPAGPRRWPADGPRAAQPGADADRPARTSFWKGRCCWPRRRRAHPPDWPTESACRRSTTAMWAGRSSRAPRAWDRRAPETGIPHYSSGRHDRRSSLLLEDGPGNRRLNAQVDRQYRKRGAAGPRLGDRARSLSRDNVNRAEPSASSALGVMQ